MIQTLALSTLSSAVDRLDAFVNTLTGQGDDVLDKGSAWDVTAVRRIPFEKLKAAYHGSYYTRRVVDLIAEDAVVRGWRVTDPANPATTQDLRWELVDKKHNIPQVLSKALKFARAYGTGYIVPITYDLQSLSKPISLDLLYEVQDVLVFDPGECKPQAFYAEDSAVTRITEPSAFRINASIVSGRLQGRWGQALSGGIDIHPSRVIPIIGHPLSTFDRMSHPFALGDSILQSMWLALARADAVDGAAAILAQEMKQDVVRVPDLKAIGTSDARAAFELRMRLIKLSKSLLNMIVLGAGEEFESRATTVSGFSDLSQSARDALVAATGIPEPILFGKATSGLASAPGTEQEAYIRKVETVQQQDVLPALNRLYLLFAAAKMGTFAGKRKAQNFLIEFNPLIRESRKDRDARSLIGAQRDSIHAGMLAAQDPEMGKSFVRYLITHRYGESGWQDDLPPFRPEEYLDPTDAEPEKPEPSTGHPDGGAPSPSEGPSAPDGQTPSTKLPAAAKEIGAQGVDLQAVNSGERRFDRLDSREVLTEWVEIDAEIYAGADVPLPEALKAPARKILIWRQQHPEIIDLLTEEEWRRTSLFVNRLTVGAATIKAMAEVEQLRASYDLALTRARQTKEPWKEPAILRWHSWGGAPAITWAQEQLLETA